MLDKFKKILYEEKGELLVLSLIVLVLACLLIGPLLSHVSTGIFVNNEVYGTRTLEQYSSDAGVTKALWYIKHQQEDVPGNFVLNDINGYTVTVDIEQIENEDETVTYFISSRAGSTVTDATVDYTAEIPPIPPVDPEDGVSYLGQAIATGLGGDVTVGGAAVITADSGEADVFAGSNLIMSGSARINGDVYARDDVDLDWSTVISGDACASGSVDTTGTVNGTRNSGVDVENPPAITEENLDNMVQEVYDETANLGTMVAGGTPYPSGLTVKNQSNISFPRITVNGNLEFSNVNTGIVFTDQVYVTGNIYFKSGTQSLHFMGPVHAGGNVYTGSGSGTIVFHDKLFAGTMSLNAAYSFTFSGPVKCAGNLTVGNSATTSFGSTIYAGGNFSYGGASSLGISDDMYIGGALILSNSARIIGPYKVVVRGNITLSGAAALTADEIPFFIVPPASTTPAIPSGVDPATISIQNSAYASAAIYAPTASLTISGASRLYGSVICKSAAISNSAQIVYISGLNDRDDVQEPGNPGTPGIPGIPEGLNLISWDIK